MYPSALAQAELRRTEMSINLSRDSGSLSNRNDQYAQLPLQVDLKSFKINVRSFAPPGPC